MVPGKGIVPERRILFKTVCPEIDTSDFLHVSGLKPAMDGKAGWLCFSCTFSKLAAHQFAYFI